MPTSEFRQELEPDTLSTVVKIDDAIFMFVAAKRLHFQFRVLATSGEIYDSYSSTVPDDMVYLKLRFSGQSDKISEFWDKVDSLKQFWNDNKTS